VLDKKLADKRIYPAIDISASGTRREEILLDPEEHRRITLLRRALSELSPVDSMETLVGKLTKSKSNVEFLMGMNVRT
jgi:transcription termination factor Rho